MNIDLTRYFRDFRVVQEYDNQLGQETLVVMSEQVVEVYDRRGEKLNFLLYALDVSDQLESFDPSELLVLLRSPTDLVTRTSIVVVRSNDDWATDSVVGLVLPSRVGMILKDTEARVFSDDTLSGRTEEIWPESVPPVILKCSLHPDQHPRYVVRRVGRNMPKVCRIDDAPLTDK